MLGPLCEPISHCYGGPVFWGPCSQQELDASQMTQHKCSPASPLAQPPALLLPSGVLIEKAFHKTFSKHAEGRD